MIQNMSLTDDELTAVIRRADPARTPANASLTPAMIALRGRITADVASPLKVRRRLRWPALVVPVAAVVVIALAIVVAFPFGPQTASAITPPALVFTPESTSVSAQLAASRELLRSAPGPAAPARESRSVGWYLQIDHPPEGGRSVAISPQITQSTWQADLSGRTTIIAGEPYWADGADTAVTTTDAPAPGTIVMEKDFAPGQFYSPVVEAPGSTPADMRVALEAFGMPVDGDAGDMVIAIESMFSRWTLTNAQHAQLLTLLDDTDELTMLGTTRDRADRDVIGFGALAARLPGQEIILLLSADTGRIVGTETIRTTPDGSLPVGAVTAYTLWDT